ncbi:tripartite tricarboxylate transporter permease [Jiangella endophytica]|uniref:tripartite tricarboxylate transporter permease n=1 Tax=Jiangella endophytica TaxID=1623398 RepID=UPI00130046B9|nr:tripartite tricarboxylate transporter permease [Jiangella endophytica]
MDFGSGLVQALEQMATWSFLLWFLIGVLNGTIFGLLPGLSGSVGIALMIPFTFDMEPMQAMGLFVAALAGQNFAGSITAILINTPGSSVNAATTYDGYPLSRQGRGGFAIGVSAMASFLGSLIGIAIIIALFPLTRSILLSFSFPELTMLGVLGLAVIAVASRGSMIKGLIAGMVGLLISFVGFAPIGGDVRYVFGQGELYDGIGAVVVLIGLFAVTEALSLVVHNQKVAPESRTGRLGRSQVWEGARYVFTKPFLLLRSSVLGTGIGLIPAVGGTLAAFLAYFQAAKTVRDPKFGQGDPRGVLAPEAANDAKDAGAALPSLAFGIPGSADWAIVLGAMIMHGITPGPNLIRDSPDIVWMSILVIIGASFVSSSFGIVFAPWLTKVTKVRASLLAPLIIVLAVTGAYGLESRTSDVLLAIAFGLLGYAMRAIGMPVIPLILGLVLGPMVERSYLQSVETFGGLSAFVTRPISLVLVILTVAVIVFEIISNRRAKVSEEAKEEGVRSATRPRTLLVIGGLGVVAAGALVLATDFREQSRTFPLIISTIMLALVVLYLAVALVPVLRRRFGGVIADGHGMEQMMHVPDDLREQLDEAGNADDGTERGTATQVETATKVETAVEPAADEAGNADLAARMRNSIILLVAFAAGVWAVGLGITVPVVLFLLMRYVGRETWRTTVITTVVTSAVLYFLFVSVLRMPLEGGTLLPF